MTTKTYNVGIYCRLSNDDERDGESVSIENQKLLLQNYVRQRGWNEIDTYIDDGYSGTNFDRPGVKRLIEDAKAKRINVILVKDLSRRPSHILCKPPRWCIIEAPQWRFYYGKKETHTGRKCP
ncbi:recombinase family protein, partial [Intestinimonas sp. HCP28S3_D6]|uniref:recombinase family protein n=1 Tax=Intestinimonas sp. HCP28S3_D6 TaxID=3438942 RepID=UPI003F88BB73